MNIPEAFRTGFREIRTNKVRSVLSFAAISVGVASLIYTLAQTRGMRTRMDNALELIGPGRITVAAKQDYESRGISPGLTVGDASAIRRTIPGLHMVYPKVSNWGTRFHYGRTNIKRARVDGVTPEWRKRDWVYTLRGRFLNNWDVRESARVAVVVEPGGWVEKPFWARYFMYERPYDKFITHHDIVGHQIRLGNHIFTVVGALKKPPRDKDPRWFRWGDPQILVPVTAYHRYILPRWDQGSPTKVDEIVIDTGDERTLGRVRRRLEVLLKARHRGEEDFEIKDMREEIEHQLSQSKKYLVVAIALGAVALLAGGIGIMNVTLATIFSRIKEIGVRRAVGASKSDIMAQFVIEAGLLGIAGSVAGIGLGIFGVQKLARHADRALSSIAWYHLFAAIGVGALISVLFSLYPAYQAAKLDPVEALKNE